MRIDSCPSCGWERFTPHCDESHVCDLTQCTRCKAYGTVDGKRWAVRPAHA